MMIESSFLQNDIFGQCTTIAVRICEWLMSLLVSPQTMSGRFFPHHAIKTDAVLSLDEDSVLSTNEVRDYLLHNYNHIFVIPVHHSCI